MTRSKRRCMYCMFYFGRSCGKYGCYCSLRGVHVSPYESCDKFRDRRVRTSMKLRKLLFAS